MEKPKAANKRKRVKIEEKKKKSPLVNCFFRTSYLQLKLIIRLD
jgi:hypothetical protein